VLPFPLENNLFLLSSETLDGVVLLPSSRNSKPVADPGATLPAGWREVGVPFVMGGTFPLAVTCWLI
jgi:hypothetical protein